MSSAGLAVSRKIMIKKLAQKVAGGAATQVSRTSVSLIQCNSGPTNSTLTFQNVGARPFSTNTILYKKSTKAVKGNKKAKVVQLEEREQEEEVVDFKQYLNDLEAKFKEALEVHKKKSSESKLGKANTQVFDNLSVKLAHNKTVNFTEVAYTSLKGRNLLITVFDPNDTKYIVSAVIAANLNLNPQVDPKNAQLLKVPLPAPTAEVKNETAKQLKGVYETFRNSASKYSLSTIRGDALKEMKAMKQNDELKKIMGQVEQMHKQYTKLLTDQFKEIEKQVFQ